MSVDLLGVHPIGDLLRLTRGSEDGARVRAEDLKPGIDIDGVVGSRLDSEVEVGADHGAEQFDGAFLHGIGSRAGPSGEIAIEAMLGAGSVPLMPISA